ncbi:MAG TPA: M48 family metallopeptidase [Myxococcaceae bacterium]|nr:M48 family metallopeptidase [Myxococcaceae bacterium]
MPFEHSNKRIAAEVALLLGVPVLLVAGGWAAFGAVVDLAVHSVPAEAERALGDGMAKVVREMGKPCDAPEVEAMARKLAAEAGMDAEHLEVEVLDDETVNAFALPGGHVFVFTGLLKKSQSPDEVAGVLAHELGHVVLRHHLRSALRSMGVGAVASAVFGDGSGLVAMLAAGSSQLVSLAFSREQEEEADAFAVTLAEKAGFDPLAVGKLLERMEAPGAPPSLLRTHPSGPDRLRKLEKLAAKHPWTPRLDVTLEALRGACAGSGDQ